MKEPLDDSVMQSLLSKCIALKTLRVTNMFKLDQNVRDHLSQQVATILATNSQISHIDLHQYTKERDQGEGAVILSALASSNSLTSMTHFKCSANPSWWSEGKESNVELLCDAIRAMTSLKYVDLHWS